MAEQELKAQNKSLKAQFEGLTESQKVNYLLQYYDRINELEYRNMKVLLIAKPFFDAVMNIDISKIKNLGIMDITKIASELMKITENEDSSWKKLNPFKKEEEKKEPDFKLMIIKAAQILDKNGISIQIDKALMTPKEDLEFIHQLLSNI